MFTLAQQSSEMRDSLNWPAIVGTILVTAVCVLMHFETIRLLVSLLARRVRSFRWAMLITVFTLLLLHVAEILLFGVLIYGLTTVQGDVAGSLVGAYDGTLGDAMYFSFAVYTTVGFGDITPTGPMRFLAGVEALIGLVLITWSASFTFLIMQQHWRELASA